MPGIPAKAFCEMGSCSGWIAKLALDTAQMIFGAVPVLFVRLFADKFKEAPGLVEIPNAF